MQPYIKSIHINKLFHLSDFDINIADEKYPHLIITGKNGSGKTVLLNAIADYLDKIKNDTHFDHLDYEKNLKSVEARKQNASNELVDARSSKGIEFYKSQINSLKGKLEIKFENVIGLIKAYNSGEFIISFYQAERKNEINQPKNPTKPKLNTDKVRDSLISQLLNFLSDLKFQEALARNEGKVEEADNFKNWFVKFTYVLRKIFDDENLELEFHYQDYTFSIHSEGKTFQFTELSDGFRAILEIVADLILKMQNGNSISSEFMKPGIVLIDEVETHLHLQLQKNILPLLTTLFPNIQFIVTTHSPFVLSSQENATAFDLEHKCAVDELTDYSYEALAEGYFDVRTDSNYVEMRLNELSDLLQNKRRTELEESNLMKNYMRNLHPL